MMHVDLSERTAIVIGSNGIVRSIANYLNAAGAKVVMIATEGDHKDVSSLRTGQGMKRSIRVIRRAGTSRSRCFAAITAACSILNHVDILVTTGPDVQAHQRSILEVTSDDWQSGFSGNLDSAFFSAQAFAQAARQASTPAIIVNMTTIRCTHNAPGFVITSAAAAAVSSLTRSLALEWAPDNVRVNAIAAGFIQDDNDSPNVSSVDEYGALIRFIPFHRLAMPDEIVDVLFFLVSTSSRYVTGQTIFVDGGYVINGGW